MSHYKSNVRDQVFNLFEVLGVDKALGQGAYADLDVARRGLTNALVAYLQAKDQPQTDISVT